MPSYSKQKFPYLIIPDGWDTAWRAALATSGTTPTSMMVIGDSMSDGYGATPTDYFLSTYPSKLWADLRTKYGTYADFLEIHANPTWWSPVTFPVTSPWTAAPWAISASTITQIDSYGFGQSMVWSSTSTNANLCTLTIPANAYATNYTLEFLWVDAVVGTFTWTLDAGGKTTVTNAGLGGGTQRRTVIGTNLTASAQHVLIITDQSAASVVMPMGAVVKPGTTGVGLGRLYWQAAYQATWGNTSAETAFCAPSDRPKMLQGAALVPQGAAVVPAAITAITNAAPMAVTIAAHGLSTGNQVTISGVAAPMGTATNTPNAKWYVTNTGTNTFTLDGSLAPGSAWTSGGVALKETGFGFPAAPALAIFALGINDCARGYGVEGFRQQLRRMVQALGRGTNQCSLIIIAMHNPAASSSDVTVPFGFATSFERYLRSLADIAQQYKAVFVDITTKWRETPVLNGYCAAGNPHPTTAGHLDIYNLLKPLVVV